jgi:hypothetical protein
MDAGCPIEQYSLIQDNQHRRIVDESMFTFTLLLIVFLSCCSLNHLIVLKRSLL